MGSQRNDRPPFFGPVVRVHVLPPLLRACCKLVPEQVIAVAHQIIVGPEFVEVVHTGKVRYADRVSALAALKAESVSERLPVLINFLDASLVVGREDREPDDQARVDYMARAIIDQFFCRRGVAMVGISSLDAKPAATAALVRNIPFQVFERREQAVVWLANLS